MKVKFGFGAVFMCCVVLAACGSSNSGGGGGGGGGSSSSSGSSASSGGVKVEGAKVIDANSLNSPPKGTINFTPNTTWLQLAVWVVYVSVAMTLFIRTVRRGKRSVPPTPVTAGSAS